MRSKDIIGWAYAALVVLWLACLPVMMCCGRGTGAATPADLPRVHGSTGRTIAQQSRHSVRVDVMCISGDPFVDEPDVKLAAGSGVIAANGTVLTAYHVIKCDPRATLIVRVVTPDKERHWATVDATNPDHDLARLKADVIAEDSVVLANARKGEEVCAYPSHPVRTRVCDEVTNVRELRPNTSSVSVDVWLAGRTVLGNSGAPVYNARGELVGIVTNNIGCVDDPWSDDCGGLASSVVGRLP